MKFSLILIAAVALLACAYIHAASLERDPWGDIPYPFDRQLDYDAAKPMSGKDVYLLQSLLNRWGKSPGVQLNSIYDKATSSTLRKWKVSVNLPDTTLFDKDTAYTFLDTFFYDNYKDNGIKAADMGLKFKVYIPVHNDRSIETIATLYDENNNVLHKYPVRTRAHTVYGDEPWPTWDNNGSGLNSFSGWGFTPSGLTLLDLNTPEPAEVEDLYGKWNVLRAVRGIQGNAVIAMPKLRNGILQHTGNWAKHGWDESKPMPNSSGCMHVHPADQETVTQILASLGVVANKNPFGQLPYPFSPQGLLSIEVIPDDVTEFDVVYP
jgi:hypothetical protein